MKLAFISLLFSALLWACGSIAPAPRYTHSDGPDRVVGELQKRRRAGKGRLLRVVNSYLGVPYKWGGTTRKGMDCSAMTRAVYRETYGLELPRTSKQMYRLGRSIRKSDLKPGDLVFFTDTYSGVGISHVGIYIGKGRFAHASVSEGGTITSLAHPYFDLRYAGARRITRR